MPTYSARMPRLHAEQCPAWDPPVHAHHVPHNVDLVGQRLDYFSLKQAHAVELGQLLPPIPVFMMIRITQTSFRESGAKSCESDSVRPRSNIPESATTSLCLVFD